jgi:hypothetical protein
MALDLAARARRKKNYFYQMYQGMSISEVSESARTILA